MTVNEMRQAIKRECDKRELCCVDKDHICPLYYGTDEDCCEGDDEKVIRNFKIMFPELTTYDPNPYWKNITKLSNNQRKKGIETYGKGIEDNNLPVGQRIQYIEEELIDALMYLEWLKDGLHGRE